MSETGSSKPSIFSHAGLMTVIAAAISAVAAVGVAYIQKSGPAEKPADASASSAAIVASGAVPAAPVYVTKLVNGRMIKVLVPAPQAGKAAAGAASAAGGAQSAAGSPEGNMNPSAAHDTVHAETGESRPQAAAQAAAEPAAEAPADSGDEAQ